jgi:hypothetical protein
LEIGELDEYGFNFVDMFKNVPPEILESKILQLDSIYELLRGNFKNTAVTLTEILSLGGIPYSLNV